MCRIIRKRPAAHRRGERRGAALVEFAVVLPVFLTVVLGIIEMGRAIMVGQLVTNAAREGARLAILDDSTDSQVISAAQSFLTGTLGVAAADVSVTITVSGTGTSLSNAEPRDLCTVVVSVPYAKVSYLPPKYMEGKSLTATSAMRHE